jgi:hypothetical protein
LIHLAVEVTDLALERQRSERFALTPADDVTVNHFSCGRNEAATRILRGEFPGLVCCLDDIGVTEMVGDVPTRSSKRTMSKSGVAPGIASGA